MDQPGKIKKDDREKISVPRDFILDEDLASAYHLMEFTGESIFLTGRAGTGKTSLLNYFRKNTVKKCVVLAPTGLAAIQIGGSTIHSFFGFPLRRMLKNDPEIRLWNKSHPKMKVLKKMDTLIIDEVSMVRADLMDAIDQALRHNLSSNLPFGGKQLILIGDAFQLPPVVNSNDLSEGDEDEYPDPYFFSSSSFRKCQPRIVELKKIYRQADPDFIYLLNKIRMGIATEDDISELNKRCIAVNAPEDYAITLTSVNAIADKVNQGKMLELKSPFIAFKASVEGAFHERLYPVPPVLKLKAGAQVMMVKNDTQGRWVNGSIGIIEKLGDDEIWVRFRNKQLHRIERADWENRSYTWDRSTNTISFVLNGTYTQYPVKPAWAITIHKSQGLTFDKIIIDMGKGAFAHGQLYVALSRCRTLGGITLRTRITLRDIIVDEAVGNFSGRHRLG